MWAGILIFLLFTGAATAALVSPALPGPTRRQPSLATLYLPAGRGYDWSFAGYRDGTVPLPSRPAKFNVKDFGAKGDGKTRDTAALQAAVAAANADPDGGVVYFPPGTYVLESTLVISQRHVVLRGAGPLATTIYIPNSLSDVFPGTWVNNSGTLKSAWDSSGGFITFVGPRQTSLLQRPLLSAVNGTVQAGDFRIPVANITKFRVGQRVRIFVNDESTGVATGDRVPAESLPGYNPALPVPDWVKQHPAYQAALAASLGGEEEATAGSSHATETGRSGADGLVQAAAVDGSLVAWVYGNNRADSGPSSGILSRDQIAFSARVVAVGPSWVDLDRPLPFPVLPRWNAVVQRDQFELQHAGLEKMTIRFRHTRFGEHFSDRGFNAIQASSATNLLFSQIRILNCDNGINLNFVDHSTIQDVTIGVTAPRWAPERAKDAFNGHHPITITSGHSNLITRFNITAKWIHDLSVAYGASLNVFSSGRGRDLNVDHHRAGPWGNLFTDIGVGLGSRPFFSSGRKGKGAHAGRGATFWNLWPSNGTASQPTAGGAAAKAKPAASLRLPKCSLGPLLNFVGGLKGGKCSSEGWLVLPLKAGQPHNLHATQVAVRLSQGKRSG